MADECTVCSKDLSDFQAIFDRHINECARLKWHPLPIANLRGILSNQYKNLLYERTSMKHELRNVLASLGTYMDMCSEYSKKIGELEGELSRTEIRDDDLQISVDSARPYLYLSDERGMLAGKIIKLAICISNQREEIKRLKANQPKPFAGQPLSALVGPVTLSPSIRDIVQQARQDYSEQDDTL